MLLCDRHVTEICEAILHHFCYTSEELRKAFHVNTLRRALEIHTYLHSRAISGISYIFLIISLCGTALSCTVQIQKVYTKVDWPRVQQLLFDVLIMASTKTK
ncbi:unnamed protein product [Meganyctiphanes norvegica]|uniref:Uncharacterized protein n=1 Tax=Meganyctiphanes norvegica TaxID=48144 RepID=A0AAV2QMR2_MEGNR